MAVSTCVVSGTLKDISGTALEGVTVEAYKLKPVFYSDGTHLVSRVSTTTSASGAWSLTLAEDATSSTTTTVSFVMPTGSIDRVRKEYVITVPNTATANFATLAAGQ